MSAQVITLLPTPLKPRRERLWIAEGKICHWCKCPTRLVNGPAWDMATNDHVIPRYKGGDNEDSNIVSACSLCNNRRSHEDARGLKDGSLLGKYKVGSDGKLITGSKRKYNCLTGDDKKALMARMDKIPVRLSVGDILKDQRDQGLKRIAELQIERDHWKSVATYLQNQSVITFIRNRFAKWLIDNR